MGSFYVSFADVQCGQQGRETVYADAAVVGLYRSVFPSSRFKDPLKMGKFGVYFESILSLKPEWRRAYIDYHSLNRLIGVVKKGVKATGSVAAFANAAIEHQNANGEGDEGTDDGDDLEGGRGRRNLDFHPDGESCSLDSGVAASSLVGEGKSTGAESELRTQHKFTPPDDAAAVSSPPMGRAPDDGNVGSPAWSAAYSTPPIASHGWPETPVLGGQSAPSAGPSRLFLGSAKVSQKKLAEAKRPKSGDDEEDDDDDPLFVNLREDSALYDMSFPGNAAVEEDDDGHSVFDSRIGSLVSGREKQKAAQQSEKTPLLQDTVSSRPSHHHRMRLLDKGLSHLSDTHAPRGVETSSANALHVDSQNATFGRRKTSFEGIPSHSPTASSVKVVNKNESKFTFVNVNKWNNATSSPAAAPAIDSVPYATPHASVLSARPQSEILPITMPGMQRIKLPAHKEFGIDFRDVKVVSGGNFHPEANINSANEREGEEEDGGAVSSHLRPQTQITFHDEAANQQVELTVTDSAIVAAEQFEKLLVDETSQATQFAKDAMRKYLDYYDRHIDRWKSETRNEKRTKDNVRYIYGEVLQMIQFIETNVLCIKTALKKYLNSHPFYVREDISEEHLIPPLRKVRDKGEALKTLLSTLWVEIFEGGDA